MSKPPLMNLNGYGMATGYFWFKQKQYGSYGASSHHGSRGLLPGKIAGPSAYCPTERHCPEHNQKTIVAMTVIPDILSLFSDSTFPGKVLNACWLFYLEKTPMLYHFMLILL